MTAAHPPEETAEEPASPPLPPPFDPDLSLITYLERGQGDEVEDTKA